MQRKGSDTSLLGPAPIIHLNTLYTKRIIHLNTFTALLKDDIIMSELFKA